MNWRVCNVCDVLNYVNLLAVTAPTFIIAAKKKKKKKLYGSQARIPSRKKSHCQTHTQASNTISISAISAIATPPSVTMTWKMRRGTMTNTIEPLFFLLKGSLQESLSAMVTSRESSTGYERNRQEKEKVSIGFDMRISPN